MKLNGRNYKLKEEITVERFLELVRIKKDCVVVEIDGEIISNNEFSKIILNDSNAVEVISFVGGG